MKRIGNAAAVSMLALLSVASIGTASTTTSKAARDSMLVAIEKDRTDTKEWLKSSPTSYLATVDRKDFENKKSMTLGSAKDNDMRLDDPAVAAHHLRVTVVGDSFMVEALDDGATFVSGKDTLRSAMVAPSRISVARFALRLSHQRFPGIIVFDPKSPRYAEYKGIEWFPADLKYRYELPLTANPNPDTVIIMSTRGNQRRGPPASSR